LRLSNGVIQFIRGLAQGPEGDLREQAQRVLWLTDDGIMDESRLTDLVAEICDTDELRYLSKRTYYVRRLEPYLGRKAGKVQEAILAQFARQELDMGNDGRLRLVPFLEMVGSGDSIPVLLHLLERSKQSRDLLNARVRILQAMVQIASRSPLKDDQIDSLQSTVLWGREEESAAASQVIATSWRARARLLSPDAVDEPILEQLRSDRSRLDAIYRNSLVLALSVWYQGGLSTIEQHDALDRRLRSLLADSRVWLTVAAAQALSGHMPSH
jgi:hypothetical protein